MKSPLITKAVIAASALTMSASPIAMTVAYAQPNPNYNDQYDQDQNGDQYNDPGRTYDQGRNDDQNGRYNDRTYDRYGDEGPPSGYDGSEAPPPPTGYEQPQNYDQLREEDRRYARYAERWAADNCVRSHGGNVAAGAVIGGIFGALIGSAVAAPGHTGAGTAVGAAIGGTTGAAIAANSSGGASPGCPPGYVLRDGSPGFYYQAEYGPYDYDAPGWYHPWVWYDEHWLYRPYPYHVWYYRHYHHDRDDWRDRHDHDQDRDYDRGR